MTEKRRIFQLVNVIVFLIFALAAEAVVCLSLFKGADMFLQIGWTGYLLLGMAFLFFVGEKIARVKMVEKYLTDSKVGRFITNGLLFFVCIGAGAAFRIWETAEGGGTISKNTIFNLVYYLIIGLFVYFTVKQISGFRGSIAAVILMALCPFFDFSAKLSVRECMYTLLVLAAIFFISLANYFVEKKSVSLQDALLTILGAVSLAGATFLHFSAIILIFPCIFLLIRKSGAAIREKREQRGLRSLLFEVFYICSLVVIFLIYNIEQRIQAVDIPIDFHLFHVIGNIGKKPLYVLETLFDKFSGLFAINNSGEYYNGLLMGMLILGMIGTILLFKKNTERRFFPVYLFNWYFFFGILLKESAYGKLVLYVLLAYMAAGTINSLSELIFAEKRRAQEETDVEEEKELQEGSAADLKKEKTEEEQQIPETIGLATDSETAKVEIAKDAEEQEGEQIADQAAEQKWEMAAALREAEKKLPKPALLEPEEAEAEAPETEEAKAEPPETEEAKAGTPETEETPVPLENSLEKQLQELIKREEGILEIVEKQNVRISKLEEELREQRIRTKKMERHYRKELAIIRNKKR